jgi:hypothetical protein
MMSIDFIIKQTINQLETDMSYKKQISLLAIGVTFIFGSNAVAQEIEPEVNNTPTMEQINDNFAQAREDRKAALRARDKDGDEEGVENDEENLTNKEQMDEINSAFEEAREQRKSDLRMRRDDLLEADSEAKEAVNN